MQPIAWVSIIWIVLDELCDRLMIERDINTEGTRIETLRPLIVRLPGKHVD